MLKVVDNTGALQVKCIRILNNVKKRKVRIGDKIVVVIKRARPHNEKIKRGKIKWAVIVRTKDKFLRNRGITLCFGENAVILINKKSKAPLSKRVKGPIMFELCLKYRFLASVARHII